MERSRVVVPAVLFCVLVLAVPALASPGMDLAGSGNNITAVSTNSVIGAGESNIIQTGRPDCLTGPPGTAWPQFPVVWSYGSLLANQYQFEHPACMQDCGPLESGIIAGGGLQGQWTPDHGGNAILCSTQEFMTPLNPPTVCPPFPPTDPRGPEATWPKRSWPAYPPSPPATETPWSVPSGWQEPLDFGYYAPYTFLCNSYIHDNWQPHGSWIGAGVLNQIRGTNNSAILAGDGSSIIHEEIDIPWMPICQTNTALFSGAPPPVPDCNHGVNTDFGVPDGGCNDRQTVSPVPTPTPPYAAAGKPAYQPYQGTCTPATYDGRKHTTFGEQNGMPWWYCVGGNNGSVCNGDDPNQVGPHPDDSTESDTNTVNLPDCYEAPRRAQIYDANGNLANGDDLPLAAPWFVGDVPPPGQDSHNPEQPGDNYHWTVDGLTATIPDYQYVEPAHDKALPYMFVTDKGATAGTCNAGVIHTYRMAKNDLIGAGTDHLITDPGSGIWTGFHNFVNATNSGIGAGLNNQLLWEYQDPVLHKTLHLLHDSAVGAGKQNQVNRPNSFVGAGTGNSAGSWGNSTIFAGVGNNFGISVPCGELPAHTYGEISTGFIGAGTGNIMRYGGCSITPGVDRGIAGGFGNSATGTTTHGAIVGGINGAVGADSFVGGGRSNGAAAGGSVGGGAMNGAGGDGGVAGGQMNFVSSPANPRWHGAVLGGVSDYTVALDAYVGGGYGENGVQSFASGVLGGSANLVQAQVSHIFGGIGGVVTGTGYSVILGGNSTRAQFESGVGGGMQDRAMGDRGAIIGGLRNNINGKAMGKPNANDAFIGGGTYNVAGANQSAIPGGSGAQTTNQAEYAFSSVAVGGQPGSAQASDYVIRAQVFTPGRTPLTLDQGVPLVVPEGAAWGFHGTIVARDTYGNTHAWNVQGALKRYAGFTSLLGPAKVVTTSTDAAAVTWAITVGTNTSDHSLEVDAFASGNVRFVGHIFVDQAVFV